MKYEIFQAMSRPEAREFLDSFLQFGKNRCREILEMNTHFTTEIDFSLESLNLVFVSLLAVLGTVPKQPDPSLPTFIRESETYKQNLFEFDERSKLIILAAAYYLGESFIRSYEGLSWSTGNPRFHQCNMPVVAGFRLGQELPVMIVTENMFGSIVSGMNELSAIETAIDAWKASID